MAETKRNRNAQGLKTRGGFRISRNPVVQIIADERHDVPDGVRLPREYGARILFAIARDPRTIFASWNIDWLALFEQVIPRDRQVHLRVHCADGLEQKTLRALDLSISDVASAWRRFDQIDSAQLTRRTRGLASLSATSSSGWREADWTSAGS